MKSVESEEETMCIVCAALQATEFCSGLMTFLKSDSASVVIEDSIRSQESAMEDGCLGDRKKSMQ